uniref:Uncharacterized protein LOC113788095 n=1 Tax=Cicer arietinum TaxID=3827 RepID=A0A3Q7YH69_CICAR|nr:uncharacterized protein LOC113788095 [Cicer arietinum]
MKELLWLAARATVVQDWEKAMQKIKAINEDAWKDMMQLPPSMWTRSAFRTDTQCDLQVNNMCEAFNMAVLEYRDKPIITLLEGLKHYITVRIVKQKELMLRYRGNICPSIQQILEKAKRAAGCWFATWHGDDDFNLFSVTNGVDTYTVNLHTKTCACRKWDLTGIPCCHALVCIWHNKADPESYVSPYYRKTNFLTCYSYIIMPSNGPKLWHASNGDPINPPIMRRAPGRPKKKRNKSNDESKGSNKLPRQFATVKCKNCGKLGHNTRTCKGKSATDREIPKGGNNINRTKRAKTTRVGGDEGETPTILSQDSQAPQIQDSQIN